MAPIHQIRLAGVLHASLQQVLFGLSPTGMRVIHTFRPSLVRRLLLHSSVAAAVYHLDGVRQNAGDGLQRLANRPRTAG